MINELDKIDHKILQFLLDDGRASFSQIARDVNLTDVAIKKRVERLKMRGIINSFSTELNLKALGYQEPIFLQLRTELPKQKEVVKKLSQMDFIIELYNVLGEYNLIAKVVSPNNEATQSYLSQLEKVDGILDLKSAVVLEHHKKSAALPTHSLQNKL
ncbi:Lrp/AsnC family transcriptional regulator [archaeon]|nr:Lrp/AsnC family transcriptional regulator [archaeon]